MTLETREGLTVESTKQLRALADETRARILRVLEDGPASAKQLSEMLAMTHGKVGHHLKILRESGFIELVEERPVRAVTERFYGLTHDRLRFAVREVDRLAFLFGQASREASPASRQPFDPPGALVTVRMRSAQAHLFHTRMMELVAEFEAAADPGADAVFGMAAVVFATDTPRRHGS